MRTIILHFILFLILLTACRNFPKDSSGTLKKVQSGSLRAGISYSINNHKDTAFIHLLAKSLNAKVLWTYGDHYHLARLLKSGEIDIAIGGFTDDSPFKEEAALTKPYHTDTMQLGDEVMEVKYVTVIPKGENAFLMFIEDLIHHEQQIK